MYCTKLSICMSFSFVSIYLDTIVFMLVSEWVVSHDVARVTAFHGESHIILYSLGKPGSAIAYSAQCWWLPLALLVAF